MLAGKRALITGSSSGIGKATAHLFAKEGATIFLTGRNLLALQAVQKEIETAVSVPFCFNHL